MTIIHTGRKIEGQIYMPEVNYTLMVLCVAVTVGFESTHQLGEAYGKHQQGLCMAARAGHLTQHMIWCSLHIRMQPPACEVCTLQASKPCHWLAHTQTLARVLVAKAAGLLNQQCPLGVNAHHCRCCCNDSDDNHHYVGVSSDADDLEPSSLAGGAVLCGVFAAGGRFPVSNTGQSSQWR